MYTCDRDMGGLLSPALLDTGHHDLEHGESEAVDDGHPTTLDEMELIYDPQLNCFYDPLTSKYYELVQSD